MQRPRTARNFLAACGVLAWTPAAWSSGFALLEQSASRLGMAFAGTTTAADDATTIYFNPAGLTQLDRFEIAVVTSGIDIASEFHDSASQPAFGQPLGGNSGDAGGASFVPSVYFAAPLGEDFAFGVGVNAPFGLATDYDSGWIGRFQALESEIKTINVNPSLAWQAHDRLSVGVGVSYQQLDAELTNAVNYSAAVAQGVQQLVSTGQLPPALAPTVIAANATLEGVAAVEGDDEAWGFNIGLLFVISETSRIGVSYRSKLEYQVAGTVTFTAPQSIPSVIGAGIVAAASASGGALASGPARVDIELPDAATVSFQQALGDAFTLFADVGWTGWSTIQELRVVRDTGELISLTPEKWEDAWRFALGGAWKLSDAVALRAGAAYDESAVPDETRTPRLPDTNRTWLAIGASWRPSEAIVLDFGYAHLFSDDVPLNHAENPAASGALVGEQQSEIDLLAAQFIYRF